MTIAISGTTGITLDGQFNSASSMGFKNRIINGGMVIDQRNAGAAQTITAGSAPYTLDRFGLYCAGANQTSQQVSATASGFQYGLQITGAASASAATLFQRIESKNIADCAGQTVTLSFKVYNSGSSTTMNMQPYYPNAVDNYSSTTNFLGSTLTLPNGWSSQTYTFTANANCTNGLGLDFQFGALGAGVTRIITGVQLEKGSTATSFDYRPYGTELALCQRYYEKQSSTGGFNAIGGNVYWASSTAARVFLNFYWKRATPTIAYSGSGTLVIICAAGNQSITNFTGGAQNYSQAWVELTSSGGTTGQAGFIADNNSSGAYISYSSEL